MLSPPSTPPQQAILSTSPPNVTMAAELTASLSGFPVKDMSLFEKLYELSVLLQCLLRRTNLPLNVIYESWKMNNTTVVENDEQSFIKATQVKLTEESCGPIFASIFAKFDLDTDGYLNEEEMINYQLNCGQNPFTLEEYQTLLLTLDEEVSLGMSCDGFISWQERLLATDKTAVLKRLLLLGCDNNLQMPSADTSSNNNNSKSNSNSNVTRDRSDSVSLFRSVQDTMIEEQMMWTFDMDEQLVLFVNGK